MNLPRILLFGFLYVAFICNVTQAQVDLNTQPSVVAGYIATLQNARQAGLPKAIDATSNIYQAILKLGEAKVSKQQAASELVEWLPVTEQRPYSTEPIIQSYIHPAARSLMAIGADAASALKSKLAITTSIGDAVLILRCLQQIYNDNSTAQLQQIRSQSTSSVVIQAVDFVLNHPREISGVTLEPED